MDIGVREVLIFVGILLICGIFFDAYFRVRDSRRSQFGFKLDDADADLQRNKPNELAGGKARIVGQTHEVTAPLKASLIEQGQSAADALSNETKANPNTDYLAVRRRSKSVQQAAAQSASLNQNTEAENPAAMSEKHPGSQKADAGFVSFMETDAPAESAQASDAQFNKIETTNETSASVVAEEVLVIHLVAKQEPVFHGEKLMQTLLALGLRYGDMNIFHRFERPEEKKGHLFSLANLEEPGNFDLESMSSFKTPGVCLFLSLPGPKRSLYAFDLMVDTARKLVHNLGAEMYDEQQSVMTGQTIEHYRQRVMEFERKQKMAKRAEHSLEPV